MNLMEVSRSGHFFSQKGPLKKIKFSERGVVCHKGTLPILPQEMNRKFSCRAFEKSLEFRRKKCMEKWWVLFDGKILQQQSIQKSSDKSKNHNIFLITSFQSKVQFSLCNRQPMTNKIILIRKLSHSEILKSDEAVIQV